MIHYSSSGVESDGGYAATTAASAAGYGYDYGASSGYGASYEYPGSYDGRAYGYGENGYGYSQGYAYGYGYQSQSQSQPYAGTGTGTQRESQGHSNSQNQSQSGQNYNHDQLRLIELRMLLLANQIKLHYPFIPGNQFSNFKILQILQVFLQFDLPRFLTIACETFYFNGGSESNDYNSNGSRRRSHSHSNSQASSPTNTETSSNHSHSHSHSRPHSHSHTRSKQTASATSSQFRALFPVASCFIFQDFAILLSLVRRYKYLIETQNQTKKLIYSFNEFFNLFERNFKGFLKTDGQLVELIYTLRDSFANFENVVAGTADYGGADGYDQGKGHERDANGRQHEFATNTANVPTPATNASNNNNSPSSTNVANGVQNQASGQHDPLPIELDISFLQDDPLFFQLFYSNPRSFDSITS
ncbi:unnamed protein product [Ambrosiozyma monospora]|uniref:Unnamed protein product n=1 Tax=Ambrosiozyma monospora TaxID=43982 RepID=A0ACB5T1Z5_AMBMO|nr:unnamed protein product [Ambrosiozyma monospora]